MAQFTNLNKGRGGGSYFWAGEHPILLQRRADGWHLSCMVPGWAEVFVLEYCQPIDWLRRLRASRDSLNGSRLDKQCFKTRREALSAWQLCASQADILTV